VANNGYDGVTSFRGNKNSQVNYTKLIGFMQ
jgi:hypothetical protein